MVVGSWVVREVEQFDGTYETYKTYETNYQLPNYQLRTKVLRLMVVNVKAWQAKR